MTRCPYNSQPSVICCSRLSTLLFPTALISRNTPCLTALVSLHSPCLTALMFHNTPCIFDRMSHNTCLTALMSRNTPRHTAHMYHNAPCSTALMSPITPCLTALSRNTPCLIAIISHHNPCLPAQVSLHAASHSTYVTLYSDIDPTNKSFLPFIRLIFLRQIFRQFPEKSMIPDKVFECIFLSPFLATDFFSMK